MEDRLKAAKEKLMCEVETQLGRLDQVNAEELGEVVDMVKDFEEALYYCAKTKELKEKEECYKEQKEQAKIMKHMEPFIKEQEMMERHYYTPMGPMMNTHSELRDMDKPYGRMYYPQARNADGTFRGGSRGGRPGFREMYDPMLMNPYEYYDHTEEWQPGQYPREMLRDGREGKSPLSRKHFMESKQTKKDPASQNKELEKYLNELADDISEMIGDATPEQKIMMSQKLANLSNKIK